VLPEDDAPVVPDVPELLLVSLDGEAEEEPLDVDGVTLPLADPLEDPMPDAEPDTEPLALGEPLEPELLEPGDEPELPDEDEPVVPVVLDPLVTAPFVGDLYSGLDWAESRGSTEPDALPPAEPMPDAEPDADPLTLGVLLELPEDDEPLGVDDAHAASVKAHATGMIHLFIEISFVFFIGGKAMTATQSAPRHALSM
jgi:hypothetical protein